MQFINFGFMSFGVMDLVDVLIFTGVFYKLYSMLKDTRAITMFLGMLTVLFLGVFADYFRLQIISKIIDSISTIFWFAFFILFAPELRRILIYIGENRIVRNLFKIESKSEFDLITAAAINLSEKRFGGLIVLQRNVGLKHIVETGTILESSISVELLVSIFYPGSPLHDGAAVISNDLIVAAQCILPLSDNEDLEKRYGTRHRAAIGMSEESDAVILVVSEETGDISIAYDGKLLKINDKNSLKNKTESLFMGNNEK